MTEHSPEAGPIAAANLSIAPSVRVPIRRALLSVYDKTGLIERAHRLADRGVEIIASGGTYAALHEHKIAATEIAALTGFPEMLDGRVKTLHPAIHAGLLARRDVAADQAALAAAGIRPIDLVFVTLYPFEARIASGASMAECVESVDVGGPSMLRAAAKNWAHVGACATLADLDEALADMATDGAIGRPLLLRLAARTFGRLSAYDSLIARQFAQWSGEPFPPFAAFGGAKIEDLRYGENPHQKAALYAFGPPVPGPAHAELIQGKPLSYNNLNDAEAAFDLVSDLAAIAPDRTACAIIKHANPAGAALGGDVAEAFERALACDRLSAFGGVAALSAPIEEAAAHALTSLFLELVIAPGASEAAKTILASKKNLRVLLTGGLRPAAPAGLALRSLNGALLVQSRDDAISAPAEWRCVSKRRPDQAQLRDLHFAWVVAKHVKSNAIVFARDERTLAIGAGQMSRVDSVRIAIAKAHEMQANAPNGGETEPLAGSVLASDAFFPFADGAILAIEAGARAVVQPGGSIKDEAVIAAIDARDAAMMFTAERHFRH